MTVQYVPAGSLVAGDVISYPGRPEAVVVRAAESLADLFGREMSAHWCRLTDGAQAREGWVPYGPGGVLPVVKED
jgi:hypothetical protein